MKRENRYAHKIHPGSFYSAIGSARTSRVRPPAAIVKRKPVLWLIPSGMRPFCRLTVDFTRGHPFTRANAHRSIQFCTTRHSAILSSWRRNNSNSRTSVVYAFPSQRMPRSFCQAALIRFPLVWRN